MPDRKRITLLVLLLTLISSCAKTTTFASPTPAPITETIENSEDIRLLPSDTPLPATYTPQQPTSTPGPIPSDTPLPSPTPQPKPLTPGEILAGLGNLSFDEFVNESYRQLKLRDPDSQVINGYADLYGVTIDDQFTNLSAEYRDETQLLESGILELLRSYDRDSLSDDQGISYDAYEWYLDMQVRGHEYLDYRLLVNPVWGLQDLPVEFLNELTLETEADAEIYIARLANIAPWMEQVVEGLKRNEQAGALPPRYVIKDTISLLDGILKIGGSNQPNASILDVYTNFRGKVNQISDLSPEAKEALLDSALQQVEESFIPAYLSLKTQLQVLSTRAVEDPNDWHLPGGEEYYDYLLEYYTGTKLDPDEIHSQALAEVSRLQGELRAAAEGLGYPAGIGMAELNQRMSEDSEIFTGNALKQKYENLISAADQAADDYFGIRASAGVITREDRDAPPAFYMAPPPGSSDPGVMVINPGFSPLLVNYNEHVLVHHETIPGHHTQIALAQELDVPYLQRYYGVNPYTQEYILQAYPEGWALYGETLAWEMGLYDGDPFANLGRLRLLLLRAVRSVVDTGLHAKGWTFDQAAAYLEDVTGIPQDVSSLTRYITNPGYPNGYNTGAMVIFELRQNAMDTLGDEFDIQGFHDVILGHGLLPISVLQRVVNDWIGAH